MPATPTFTGRVLHHTSINPKDANAISWSAFSDAEGDAYETAEISWKLAIEPVSAYANNTLLLGPVNTYTLPAGTWQENKYYVYRIRVKSANPTADWSGYRSGRIDTFAEAGFYEEDNTTNTANITFSLLPGAYKVYIKARDNSNNVWGDFSAPISIRIVNSRMFIKKSDGKWHATGVQVKNADGTWSYGKV